MKEKVKNKEEITENEIKEEKVLTFTDVFNEHRKGLAAQKKSLRPGKIRRKKKEEKDIPDRSQKSIKDFFKGEEKCIKDMPNTAKRKLEVYETAKKAAFQQKKKKKKLCVLF